MRRQNVIVFSSGRNKQIAHEIARGLDNHVCRAVVWDEFFNKIYGEEYTLTKSYALFPFLIKKIPSFDYAVIVAGDIFLLHVEPVHPWLMWLTAAAASTVFLLLIYSMVLSFGNIGRGLVIVIMVIIAIARRV